MGPYLDEVMKVYGLCKFGQSFAESDGRLKVPTPVSCVRKFLREISVNRRKEIPLIISWDSVGRRELGEHMGEFSLVTFP